MRSSIITGRVEEWLPRLPEGKYQCILADPPYYRMVDREWDHRWETEGDYLEWTEAWLAEAGKKLGSGGTLFLWGWPTGRNLLWFEVGKLAGGILTLQDVITCRRRKQKREGGLDREGIPILMFSKKGYPYRIKGGAGSNIIEGVKPDRNRHQCAKPKEATAALIEIATEPKEWVLELFCGGAPGCKAAKEMGRRWTGIEENPIEVRRAKQWMRNDRD